MAQNGSRRAAGAATDSVGIIKADASENTRQTASTQSRTELAAPFQKPSGGGAKTRLINITGQRLGLWTVHALRPERSRWGEAVWICCCDCGTKREVTGSSLRRGNSTNCGCRTREKTRERSTKHGQARRGKQTSAYGRWAAMMRRCYNPNSRDYPNYGGRGIYVQPEWHDFQGHYADVGDAPPDMWLDRIDNDGPYGPGNWKWATPTEQARNRRPPKRKRRRSTVEEIQAFVASMKRASAPGGVAS